MMNYTQCAFDELLKQSANESFKPYILHPNNNKIVWNKNDSRKELLFSFEERIKFFIKNIYNESINDPEAACTKPCATMRYEMQIQNVHRHYQTAFGIQGACSTAIPSLC